ncbi:MAG TPA: hypothetical protein VH968_04905 [Gaiellaceae bacterium]|jgi:hypothetical protein
MEASRVENGVQFGDLAEFVDFAYVARVTKVNGAALAALANGPRRGNRSVVSFPTPG